MAAVTPRDVLREGPEPAGLQPERAGRAEQRRKPRRRHAQHRVMVEGAGRAEPLDGALGVAPGGVLREDRSNDDLEPGAGGPPALRAVAAVQAIIESEQAAASGIGTRQERRRRQHGRPIIRTRAARRQAAALARAVLLGGLFLARAGAADPPAVTVAVGGPAEDPAYLPVHAAVALGTFEAEGVKVTLKRTKHPTEAAAALRGREVPIAVTTLDEAIRGAWARKIPVQVLAAHVRAPALALLVAPVARETVRRVEDFRGKAVGIPGPGSTGHLLLALLLRQARLEPTQVDVRSVGTTGLLARLGEGELAAAMVEEPWASRLLAADRAG